MKDRGVIKYISDKIMFLGIGLAFLYWMFETVVMDVFVFHEGTFAERLIPSTPHDLWLRLLVVSLLVIFGAFAQFAINWHKQLEEKLRYLNSLYITLCNVNQTIVRIHNLENLLKETCRIPIKQGLFQMAWIGLVDADTLSVKPVACFEKGKECIEKILVHPFVEGISEGNNFICNNISDVQQPLLWHEEARKRGYRAFAVFPLVVGGRVMGTLNVYSAMPHSFESEEVNLLDEMAKDISFAIDYIEQGEKRRKAEEFNRDILESMTEGLVVIDRDYNIITANRAYCEQAEKPLEEIRGKHCYEISHHFPKPCYEAGEKCAPKYTLETGESHTVTHTHHDAEGNQLYIETKAYPMKDASRKVVSVIEVCIDITEKRKLEDQLRQSQKMEAVGQIAGGIAHDFNNILTAIIGYASLLQMKMGEDDPLKVYIEPIITSTERAANLTQGLLAFNRKQISNPQPVNLNDIVKKVEKFLTRVIGEDIELKVILNSPVNDNVPQPLIITPPSPSYLKRGRAEGALSGGGEGELMIMADPGQIEQVLMNLATNARDAMPTGGLLTIENGTVEIDDEYIKAHGYGKAGMYALISVTDSGIGMDEKTRGKIFEPFFTTKEVGKGTGLGLSIVYGIVKQHNGYVNCYSEPGKGTTFRIYLPLIQAVLTKVKPVEVIGPAGGTETILLAEDEENVRALTRLVLEEYGYKVIEAIDGEDAVNKFMENKDKIVLLLFDVIMPKMSGKEAFDMIRKIRPDIKALFASGYPADFIHRKKIDEEGLPFVVKPISPTALIKKVREALDK